MGILVISVEDQSAIAAAIDKARANPTPLSAIKGLLVDDRADPKDTLTFNERPNMDEVRKKYPTQKLELGTYNVAFSFEEQPAGLIRHLSVAVTNPNSKLVPSEPVVRMIAEAFGFIDWPPHRGWVEEYEPGRNAVNIVQIEDAIRLG